MLNHFGVGQDSHTRIERLKGERSERTLAEFGECVFYLPLDYKDDSVSIPDCKLKEGVWLGIDMQTSEVLIGTGSGIVKTRTVRRKVEADRWCIDLLQEVKGVPLDPSPGVDTRGMPTVVQAPPDVDRPMDDPDATEPGLNARRAIDIETIS